MLDLNNQSILITGGTGSFGKAFVTLIFERFPKVKRLVVFSRDEQKHFNMAHEFSNETHKAIRYFIGDVRDKSRLMKAFEGIDIVIHAAAMKHVHLAEYNPMECIKTNVLGSENVISAALACGVKKVVALSTDKAAAPVNLYGATKLTADKLFIAANNIKGNRDIIFSVVRYGNVMGSNGSVVPFFLKNKEKGVLPITDKRMTRFNISLNDGCEVVFGALEHAWGGEIFVPKIPSYNIVDVANAVDSSCKQVEVGIRPGEKLHEEMITTSDALNTYDNGKYYVILPSNPIFNLDNYKKHFKSSPVSDGFCYTSQNNDVWETKESLKKLIYGSGDTNCLSS